MWIQTGGALSCYTSSCIRTVRDFSSYPFPQPALPRKPPDADLRYPSTGKLAASKSQSRLTTQSQIVPRLLWTVTPCTRSEQLTERATI